MRQCFACKQDIPADLKVGRKDTCTSCARDLRCCRNCIFFDTSVSKQCRETIAELVKEKEKANFCEYFMFGDRKGSAQGKPAEDARKALSDLFNK